MPDEILCKVFEYLPLGKNFPCLAVVSQQFFRIETDVPTRRRRRAMTIMDSQDLIDKELDVEVLKLVYDHIGLFPSSLNLNHREIATWLHSIDEFNYEPWDHRPDIDTLEWLLCENLLYTYHYIETKKYFLRQQTFSTERLELELLYTYRNKYQNEWNVDDIVFCCQNGYICEILVWFRDFCQILPDHRSANSAFSFGWIDVVEWCYENGVFLSNDILDLCLTTIFNIDGFSPNLNHFIAMVQCMITGVDWLVLNGYLQNMLPSEATINVVSAWLTRGAKHDCKIDSESFEPECKKCDLVDLTRSLLSSFQ